MAVRWKKQTTETRRHGGIRVIGPQSLRWTPAARKNNTPRHRGNEAPARLVTEGAWRGTRPRTNTGDIVNVFVRGLAPRQRPATQAASRATPLLTKKLRDSVSPW